MKSPIKWVGGKRKEIKYFKKYIPEFETYIEPFIGGGALYWELEPKKAVINDINKHLINFYETLRDDYFVLHSQLQEYINTKDYYYEIINKLNNKLYNDKIEQACIFYYLNRTAFSGMWRVNSKGKFNTSYGSYKTDTYKELSNEYCNLLSNTEIYNGDYINVMNTYKEDDNAFIFLDPPYMDCDTLYTDDQSFENIYKNIFEFIKTCKCKVMLVVKENEYIKNLFNNYIIDQYGVAYRNNANSKLYHNHLIITNYEN